MTHSNYGQEQAERLARRDRRLRLNEFSAGRYSQPPRRDPLEKHLWSIKFYLMVISLTLTYPWWVTLFAS